MATKDSSHQNYIRTVINFAVRIIVVGVCIRLISCSESSPDYKERRQLNVSNTTSDQINRPPCKPDSVFDLYPSQTDIRFRLRDNRLLSVIHYLKFSCNNRLDLSDTNQSTQLIPLSLGNSWRYSRLYDNDTNRILDELLFNLFPDTLSYTATLPLIAIHFSKIKQDSSKSRRLTKGYWSTTYLGVRKWFITNSYTSSDSSAVYVFSYDPRGPIVGFLPIHRNDTRSTSTSDTVTYFDMFPIDPQPLDSCGNITGWHTPVILKTVIGELQCYPYTGSNVDTLYFARGIGVVRAAFRVPSEPDRTSFAIELSHYSVH